MEKAPVAKITTRKEVCVFKEVCDEDDECNYQDVCEWKSETIDVNEDLQIRLAEFCMEDRGYRSVVLPVCPDNVRGAVAPRPTTVMPRLTDDTCYIRYDDGSIQIVNPVYMPG